MDLPSELINTMSAQHGLVSTDQLRLLHVDARDRRRWERAGYLEVVTRRVRRVAGAPHSPEQSAMAAVLDTGPGAVLSHDSAASLVGVPGLRLEPFHVIYPRAGIRHDDSIAVVHSSHRLPPHHITVHRGIPMTRPVRTIFDLAATLHPLRTTRALDAMGARRLVRGDELHDLFDELRGRGRAGTELMRSLLLDRPRDWVPAESNLEVCFHDRLAKDGQPPMRRQVELGDGLEWFGRVDGWDDLARVIAEIDSDLYHRSLTDRAKDEERDAKFAAAGIVVVRIAEFDVWHDPGRFLRPLWETRQEGRERHGHPRMVRRYVA